MEVYRVKQFNVFMLGLCFMMVFTGFNTMGGIQEDEQYIFTT